MAHVLVVDDDRAIRELLRIVLEAEGHTVTLLPDGSGVIALLQERQEPFIVLMDLMMPHVTGWQVCGQIAASDTLRRHAVVVMTAAYGPDTVCPAPALRLLRKPFTVEAVTQLVAELDAHGTAVVPQMPPVTPTVMHARC